LNTLKEGHPAAIFKPNGLCNARFFVEIIGVCFNFQLVDTQEVPYIYNFAVTDPSGILNRNQLKIFVD
jgi:hypothetical protein